MIIDDNPFNILALKLQIKMILNIPFEVSEGFSGEDGLAFLSDTLN